MSIHTEKDIWDIHNLIEKSFKPSIDIKNIDNNDEKNDEDIEFHCSICNKEALMTYNDGYLSCSNCGEQLRRIIDTNAEWRFYGSDDTKSSDPTRCGMPVNNLLLNMSCGTTINCKGKNNEEIRTLRTIHRNITSSYSDRSLLNIFEQLQIMAINNDINACIVDDAKILYKNLREVQISRGLNRKALIATCLFTACNINNVTKSQKDISEIFQIKNSTITLAKKKLLEINNYVKSNLSSKLNVSSPSSFIPNFCNKLGINNNYIKLILLITKLSDTLPEITENTPPATAAGVIYFISQVCNLKLSKKLISDKCDISQVTINKCYKKLIIFKDLFFTDEIKKIFKLNI